VWHAVHEQAVGGIRVHYPVLKEVVVDGSHVARGLRV